MVPVRKTSKTRKNKRRSHHAMTPVNFASCPKCGRSKLPHTACSNCGYVSSGVALATKEAES